MALTLLAIVLLQSAPPPQPPPPPEPLAAALDLWRSRPLDPMAREKAIDLAVTGVVGYALEGRQMQPDYWSLFHTLSDAFRLRVYRSFETVNNEAETCSVSWMAYNLSVDEIRAAKSFAATKDGGRFFDVTVRRSRELEQCYASATRPVLLPFVNDELARIGLGPRTPTHQQSGDRSLERK